jgi:hypothetical protein
VDDKTFRLISIAIVVFGLTYYLSKIDTPAALRGPEEHGEYVERGAERHNEHVNEWEARERGKETRKSAVD